VLAKKSASGTEPKVDEITQTREHLGVLCQVLNVHLQPQIQLQLGLTVDSPKVTFSDLWYVFKPGYEVRTSGRSQIQL
jgi:hypothetical protein